MLQVSQSVRARMISLGAMSRSLGEERAVALALELTRSVVNEMARAGDPERTLGSFESRLRQEIARERTRAAKSRGDKTGLPLHELLPEIAPTGVNA